MYLYLMRHGEAVSAEENIERPLSEQGKQEVTRTANFLKTAELPIDVIYHSPKVRAIQTAEIIYEKLKLRNQIEILSCLEPENDIKKLMFAIDKLKDRTLLVGHLPNLELLSNYLITGNMNMPTILLFPASIACFKKEATNWSLHWLLDPMLLKHPV